MTLFRITYLALLTTFLSTICFSQLGTFSKAGFEDDSIFIAYYTRFQKAVQDNDSVYLASLLDYPFKVDIDYDKNIVLKSEKDFLRKFSTIYNQRLCKLILSQPAGKLFVNWKGVMVGNGQMWFEYIEDNKGLRIIIKNISNYH